MLYRATPAWEEPTEVREMLDASDELDVIPEDAVRTLQPVTAEARIWLCCRISYHTWQASRQRVPLGRH